MVLLVVMGETLALVFGHLVTHREAGLLLLFLQVEHIHTLLKILAMEVLTV